MAKHRKTNSKTSSSSSTSNETAKSIPLQASVQPQQHLPPKRQGKAVKRTAAPLYKTSFNNFVYTLATIAICLFAFYTYKITAWKTQAGGWWNLATGNIPAPETSFSGGTEDNSVEAKISQLASVFGIPPATLATAIASAVSVHAAPASLSPISKNENEAPTASVIHSLVQDHAAATLESANGFVNKLGSVVGFDDADAGLE
jgi:hypothetical protein